jgi:putative thiamine transport system substrate-binding protein
MMSKLPLVSAIVLSLPQLITTAFAQDWSAIEAQARGQKVYFNAWGGSDVINNYIEWAAERVAQESGVEVELVKISDAAAVVTRIATEFGAGNTTDGSVDLMWVNGENFRRLKQEGLLADSWATELPNAALVDYSLPVTTDFSIPTDGQESPWGGAQLTLIYHPDRLEQTPADANELLALAQQQPGKLAYPRVPDFHATSFLKQLLLDLSNEDAALYSPVTEAEFERVSAPLWSYLDKLHPLLWREANAFPQGIAQMHSLFADGELLMSLSFNPNDAANLVRSGTLPEGVRSFGFERGMLGNIHFVAIPGNSGSKAGAKVFANFLLSPEAQLRKADLDVWGDPSVLDQSKATRDPAALPADTPWLAEPHASWVEPLEKAWLQRYGAGS